MGPSPGPPVDRREKNVLVGGRIRSIRKEHGLSISQVSRLAGISTGHLSQIERDMIEPSLSVLQKLAAALDTSMLMFFNDYDCEDVYITTPESRQAMFFSDTSLSWQALTPGTGRDGGCPGFSARISAVDANQADFNRASVHTYWEMLYLLEGAYRYETEYGDVPLSPGDGVFFPAGVAHRGQNEGHKKARLLVVNLRDPNRKG